MISQYIERYILIILLLISYTVSYNIITLPNRYKTSLSSASESASLPPLPSKLETYVAGFARLSDEKMRYKQLLFLAQKCPPMDEALKVEDNKVRGRREGWGYRGYR